jgi:hypothetical protein
MNVQRLFHSPIQLQPSHMLRLWRHKPKIFAKDAFDLTLDPWQEEVFDLYMEYQRLGLIASKGPGKTFTLAVLGWHFFTCHHKPKIAALAITADHLKSNLWAELARLHARSELLKRSVNPGAERFSLKGSEMYSFIDARSFPKQADNTQMSSALAGLHADNVAFLLDEAGMIPDAVLATADAALSTGDSDTKKARILAAGNPEVAAGMLYRASIGKTEQKWAIYHVSGDPDDPKRAPRVSVQWAREQIATYGKDDPWVLVNVFGKYPPVATNTLLSDQEIFESMNRNIKEEEVKNSQTRLGVDVSRGGVDRTIFAKRKGLKAYPLEEYPSTLTGPDIAGKIAFRVQEENIERVFVDNTGGYGASAIDSLGMFPNLDVTPVVYNKKAHDKRYFNLRTEMYVRMRDWVKRGGQLPNDKALAEELMMPKLIFHGGVFRLEEKEQIKARLGRSPDRADAFAQTFADVEQPSFFADYNTTRPDGTTKPYDEIVRDWLEGKLNRQANSYVSDESQLDKIPRSSPNYRA